VIPILMPQVGQDIPSAEIVQWVKKEGDPVKKGDEILVVESEKAAFSVEAEQSGVLLKILHKEGEVVAVFATLGYIGEPGEVYHEGQETEKLIEAAAAPAAADSREPGPAAAAAAEPAGARLFVSPAARRIAKEQGLDLRRVEPTGPHGRILKRDVLAAVASSAGEETEETSVPFGKLRREMARRLTLSKQTIPHFYLFADVDMTDACLWRETVNREHRAAITITDMIIKATAVALREFERLNAHVAHEQMILKKSIHIGVAVSVPDGLLVPVIRDADTKNLLEISETAKKNAEAARRGFLSAESAGTFTITSLGMHGVRMFLPVINPPECAILAVGAIEPRVLPAEGGIAVCNMMTLTLACDHRAVDGVYAGRFLNKIKHYLESISQTQEEWASQ